MSELDLLAGSYEDIPNQNLGLKYVPALTTEGVIALDTENSERLEQELVNQTAEYIMNNGVKHMLTALKGGVVLTQKVLERIQESNPDYLKDFKLHFAYTTAGMGYNPDKSYTILGDEGQNLDFDGSEVVMIEDLGDTGKAIINCGKEAEKRNGKLTTFVPYMKIGDDTKKLGVEALEDAGITTSQIQKGIGPSGDAQVYYLGQIANDWIQTGGGASSDLSLGEIQFVTNQYYKDPNIPIENLAPQIGDCTELSNSLEVDVLERMCKGWITSSDNNQVKNDLNGYLEFLRREVGDIDEEMQELLFDLLVEELRTDIGMSRAQYVLLLGRKYPAEDDIKRAQFAFKNYSYNNSVLPRLQAYFSQRFGITA